MKRTLLLSALLLAGCNDGGSPTSPTTTTTAPPVLQISGSVTTFRFELSRPGSEFGTISYVVTTISNRRATGCFVRVRWLDSTGVQVSFTFAATDTTIPAGTSTITNQQFLEARIAERIRDSRVEYELCVA